MSDQHQHPPDGKPFGRRSKRELRGAAGAFRTRFALRVTSVRAKSSRHGKSTADKWNQ